MPLRRMPSWWFRRARTAPPRRNAALRVEALEDRSLPASLSGVVFLDNNGDGIQQVNEPGIAGVEMQLRRENPTRILTARTGSDGAFIFSNVDDGVYDLIQTQPTGLRNGTIDIGTGPGTVDEALSRVNQITLTGNTNLTGYRFNERPVNIAGNLFRDLNGNGIVDGGETAFDQPTVVRLTYRDVTGASITTEQVSDATTGNFTFPQIAAPDGQISVTVVQPTGFVVSATQPLQLTITQSQITNGTVNLPPFGLTVPARLSAQTTATVSGSDVPVPGASLVLSGSLANGNSFSATLVTDANGNVSFENLLPGTYSLRRQGQVAGFQAIAGPTGSIVGNCGGQRGDGIVSQINILPGDQCTGYGFRYDKITVVTAIRGRVIRDQNGDGSQNGGDAGMPGVLVTLTLPGANAGTLVAFTDTLGNYQFNNLPEPGTYRLTFTPPVGFVQLNQAPVEVVVPAGATNPVEAPTQFVSQASSFSGFAFIDQGPTPNGVKDPSEPGLAGIRLTLRGQLNRGGQIFILDATTGADGSYRFENLLPGRYSIVRNDTSLPAGFAGGPASIGTVNGLPSGSANAGVIGIVTDIILATEGSTAADYNFAQTVAGGATVRGRVFSDGNGDGVRSSPEADFEGAILTLSSGSRSFLGRVAVGWHLFVRQRASRQLFAHSRFPGWSASRHHHAQYPRRRYRSRAVGG